MKITTAFILCIGIALSLLLLCFAGYFGGKYIINEFSAYGNNGKEYSSEELKYRVTVDAELYTYSEKATVIISRSSGAYNDRLKLKTIFYDGEETEYEALSGKFKEVAWNDYMLYIHMGDVYYSFDIKNYNVPDEVNKNTKTDEKGVVIPEYNLKKYLESDFKKQFPDYKSYEWYGH